MKTIALAAMILGMIVGTAAEADVAACAAGPHRAGCVGPRGAVGVHRGYGYHGAAVVHPGYGRHCYRGAYGRMVCR